MMMDSSVDENTMADGTATIKVIGVGGAGTNAVNRMVDSGISTMRYLPLFSRLVLRGPAGSM